MEVDLSIRSGKVKRVNITLPERVLAIIDQVATEEGDTRSRFLVKAALEYVMQHKVAINKRLSLGAKGR